MTEVLITGDASKLPPDIAALLNPAIPLPEGILYFEKQYDLVGMAKTVLIASGFGLASVIVVPFGVAMLFDHHEATVYSSVDYWPLGFGLVLLLATWMMFASLGSAWKFRAMQKQGQCTRRGTFLVDDLFVQASENDTTIIPRHCFAGLKGNDVKYRHNNLDKSFRLPNLLVNSAPILLHQAISDWAAKRPME